MFEYDNDYEDYSKYLIRNSYYNSIIVKFPLKCQNRKDTQVHYFDTLPFKINAVSVPEKRTQSNSSQKIVETI